MDKINTTELQPFAERYRLKVATVIRRIQNGGIPGIRLIGSKYTVMDGTRYPYDKRKIKKSFDTKRKRLELLRAIKDDRYIDESILGVEKRDFDAYLQDYLNAGFIEERGCENKYGANNYRTTDVGNRVFDSEKSKMMNQLMENAGIFMGELISHSANNQ